MATVYIEEFVDLPTGANGQLAPIARAPGVARQTVAVGGSSTQSSAFNAKTRYVRLHTDTICSVLFGANPTATTSSPRMAADQTEYFAVNPGDRVAVIANT